MTVPKVDTIAFMVIKEGKLLVERRSLSARTDPGIIAIPGGHVNEGETLVEAVQRELREETGINCDSFTLIMTKKNSTPLEAQTVHYYLCNDCVGALVSNEADELFWMHLDDELIKYKIGKEAILELRKHLATKSPE